jgi:hypothetical protein
MLLMVVTLVDAMEGGGATAPSVPGVVPDWAHGKWFGLWRRLRETCDWRVFALGGVLFTAFVVLAGVLFMAIPRFQLDSGLFIDRLMTKKSTTGFSDTLKFDDVTDIQQDNSVVLRVEASDRSLVPAALYWRLVVLDEYRSGTFQMSAITKASAFRRDETSTRITGTEPPTQGSQLLWTFYLEAGVGRYLPLSGAFRRLVFTEPQMFRTSPSLQLVMLSRDPVSMKAYRVEGMNTSARMDDVTTRRIGHATEQSLFDPRRSAMLDPGVGEEDRVILNKILDEITGGAKLEPEEFARAAMVWLARRHTYSLKCELPSGQNDPLVRWLVSKEPGHCELFAGAFTLLARAVGHPTRVIAGFMGGSWNEDYLIVRNSDAHAWCELYDERGHWLRIDPTNDGPRLLRNQTATSSEANLRDVPRGWAARFDRLRMLWYRRIVNFDHSEQQELIRDLKNTAEGTGRQLREWTTQVVSKLKHWLSQPWGYQRWVKFAGGSLLVGLTVFVIWRHGHYWWARWRCARGQTIDPVRLEAGRWLRRLERAQKIRDVWALRDELERLRYGRQETWPEPRQIFRKARQACRQTKARSKG